jgi:SAM-dependent methyltransferase
VDAKKITAATVRADFNDPVAVAHYARAAHFLGLWASERALIEKYFPNQSAPLLEAGCGAGRVAVALAALGYANLTAFDFAAELVDQAKFLAEERGATAIRFLVADATKLSAASNQLARPFAGALFLFNGLMQIPGRRHRRAALCELHRGCATGAPLLITTHDRDCSPTERAMWRLEALRWEHGEQDRRLVEFGDRYFEDEAGRTFMHLPDRGEILADFAATGWIHEFDAMREEVAKESPAVREFSDECRFWVARRG